MAVTFIIKHLETGKKVNLYLIRVRAWVPWSVGRCQKRWPGYQRLSTPMAARGWMLGCHQPQALH